MSSCITISKLTSWGLFAALAIIFAAHPAAALRVYTGYDVAFNKGSFVDPADPANQDAITSAVSLTRADSRGIYNAVMETDFVRTTSPADTEWAFAHGNPTEELSASNHAALEFAVWTDAHGGNPPSTVGQNAVLHLISEDIYLDIRFTGWGPGGGGGSFSYERSLIPEPSAALLIGLGMAGLGMRLRREPAARRG